MILLAGENRRVVFSRTATADVDWPVHIKLEPAWRGAPVWSGSWHGRVGAGGPTCSCSRKKGEKTQGEKEEGRRCDPLTSTSAEDPGPEGTRTAGSPASHAHCEDFVYTSGGRNEPRRATLLRRHHLTGA
jgi:hypothetical protein